MGRSAGDVRGENMQIELEPEIVFCTPTVSPLWTVIGLDMRDFLSCC